MATQNDTKRIISDIQNGFESDIEDILDEVAASIVSEARSNIQNNGNINAGDLLSSVDVLAKDPIRHTRKVGSTKDYSEAIEYGRPEIRPKNPDGALRWIDKDTGEVVYSKYSGPTEPQPFLEPAVILHTKDFENLMAEKLNKRQKT